MWANIRCKLVNNGIVYRINESVACDESDEANGVKITFGFTSPHQQPTRLQALKVVARVIAKDASLDWLSPVETTEWQIDLDKLGLWIETEVKNDYGFLSGKVRFQPEVEVTSGYVENSGKWYHASVFGIITPKTASRPSQPRTMTPPAIVESLNRFRAEYPDPSKAAFIMMAFGQTGAHDNIVKAIRGVLGEFGIAGLRADDKQYNRDVFQNVETYMHGCGFGIAIFERIESDKFNSNVGLEVGYMMSMGKPVCYLKDRTLTALQTDLIGALYRSFDTQRPDATIPKELEIWLRDWDFIRPKGGGSSEQVGLQQKLEYTLERPAAAAVATTAVADGTGEFLEYYDGLGPDELYLLAKFVLIEEVQTLSLRSNDNAVASLVAKKFIKRVPVAQSLLAMRDQEPTPYTVLRAAWRFLNENRRKLLDSAKMRNLTDAARTSALSHITLSDDY
jgi:hypothetical protein